MSIGDHRAIRVTPTGDAVQERDVIALKKWLEAELGQVDLDKAETTGHMQIRAVSGPGDDAETPMGLGAEFLLIIITNATAPVFQALYQKVDRGVRAWLANRGNVERGGPTSADVREVDPDTGE